MKLYQTPENRSLDKAVASMEKEATNSTNTTTGKNFQNPRLKSEGS